MDTFFSTLFPISEPIDTTKAHEIDDDELAVLNPLDEERQACLSYVCIIA